MKPTIGRIVICKGILANGTDEHPAIVNRVWSDLEPDQGTVRCNLTVFPDLAPPRHAASAQIFNDRSAAQAHMAAEPGQVVCFWPDRT